jgi:hypothetical protein
VDATFASTVEVSVGPETVPAKFWESVTWPVFYGANCFIIDGNNFHDFAEIYFDEVKVWDTLFGENSENSLSQAIRVQQTVSQLLDEMEDELPQES